MLVFSLNVLLHSTNFDMLLFILIEYYAFLYFLETVSSIPGLFQTELVFKMFEVFLF
jgi:hypothetical protein